MASEIETGQSKKTGRLTVFLILFTSFLAMIAAAAVSVEYSVHRYWRSIFLEEITRNLPATAQMLAARVNTDPAHKNSAIPSPARPPPGPRPPDLTRNST